MKIQYNHTRRILRVLVIAVAMAFVVSGCVSEIDKSFTPFSSNGLHPFDSVMDHGDYLKDDFMKFEECAQCHGTDLRGADNGITVMYGENDRSCFQCHNVQNHGVGMVNAAIEHPQFLRDNGGNRSACYTCHTRPGSIVTVEFAGSCSNASCH